MAVSTRIVVGIDGSDCALNAVRWAAQDAVLRGASLLLATSILSGPGTYSDAANLNTGIFAGHDADGATRLLEAEEVAHKAVKDHALTIETITQHGPAAKNLVQLSDTASMLVVGSRGLGEFTGGLLGSVSTTVSAHAACPVTVVKGLPSPDQPPLTGPVVVGVDSTKNSEAALAAAFEEADLRGADLVAVHAWSDASLSVMFMRYAEYEWSDLLTAEEANMTDTLSGWVIRYPNVRVRLAVVEDRPVRRLVHEAEGAQLIVMGSRGRGGFPALLLGSTSRAVLHAVNTPVLIVRSHHQ